MFGMIAVAIPFYLVVTENNAFIYNYLLSDDLHFPTLPQLDDA